MKIAIGCDHGGYVLKPEIMAYLKKEGYEIIDFGTDNDRDSVDYPDYGRRVAIAVRNKEADLGILMCGTGIGISIAANKVPGIRCALVADTFSAHATREHNDANIIAMGGRTIGAGLAVDIVDAFLTAEFSRGERHQKRIDKITAIEKEFE